MCIIIIGGFSFAFGPFLDRSGRKRYRAAVLFGAIAAYLYFIFVITILGRPSRDIPQTEVIPLVSWYRVFTGFKSWYYVKENLLNILLFTPLGLLSGAFWRIKAWQAFVFGLILSLIIELIQLATCRGYFAWDDMLHNAVGLMLGVLIINVILRKRRERRYC